MFNMSYYVVFSCIASLDYYCSVGSNTLELNYANEELGHNVLENIAAFDGFQTYLLFNLPVS